MLKQLSKLMICLFIGTYINNSLNKNVLKIATGLLWCEVYFLLVFLLLLLLLLYFYCTWCIENAYVKLFE